MATVKERFMEAIKGKPKPILEKWLKTIPDVDCKLETLRVIAPTCYGECKPAVQRLIDDMNGIFGGSTNFGLLDDKKTGVEGCWFNPEIKKKECEPVVVIDSGHNCSKKEQLQQVAAAITRYATDADQHSISIVNNRFYIGETPYIRAATEKLLNK